MNTDENLMSDISICFIFISSLAHNFFMIWSIIYDFLFEMYIWNKNKLKTKVL